VVEHLLIHSLLRCWCGLSAAILWCAEGTAITAFASEDKKGPYVSIMWSIFQSGVVIGSAIPVGQNWNSGTNNDSRVNDGTYIGLMILILFGAALALVLYPWQKMVREDGSKVLVERHLSFFQELASSCMCSRTIFGSYSSGHGAEPSTITSSTRATISTARSSQSGLGHSMCYVPALSRLRLHGHCS
jgi:MFS family permease